MGLGDGFVGVSLVAEPPYSENPFPAAVNSSSPLDNFPLIRSRDIEEVREALARVYARPALVPAPGVERLNATYNNCRLQHIEVAYVTFGAAVALEFPATSVFSHLFPVRGAGQITRGKDSVSLTVGTCAVASSDAGHTMNYDADYEYLVLRISSHTLTKRLTALTGVTIDEPLRMDLQQNSKRPAAQMLQQYLPRLVDTLSEARPPFPDWWIAQTEQFLMTLFLCGHRHNYSHLLEDEALAAPPAQVWQAEEYIEANAGRAITLEELAEVTGVCAFSLYSAFKKYRGYSPFEFLSQVRARREGVHR
jgi:AraC-binding-like domain